MTAVEGSEFVVRLPLAIRRLTAEGWATTTPTAVPQQRILVVDDNRDAADSLGMLLRFQGADVHIVDNGPTALEALTTYGPSVVLLDIGMPGMDGYELARRMRQQQGGEDVTLIALTGWGQEQDRRLSKEAGIDYHLIKPVDWESLVSLLTSLARAKGRAQ